jgi:hypothetical protein
VLVAFASPWAGIDGPVTAALGVGIDAPQKLGKGANDPAIGI